MLSAFLNINFLWSLYYICPKSRLCCCTFSSTLMSLYINNTSRVSDTFWPNVSIITDCMNACCQTQNTMCYTSWLPADPDKCQSCWYFKRSTELKQWTPHTFLLLLPAKLCCFLLVLHTPTVPATHCSWLTVLLLCYFLPPLPLPPPV